MIAASRPAGMGGVLIVGCVFLLACRAEPRIENPSPTGSLAGQPEAAGKATSDAVLSPTMANTAPVDLVGLHNVVAYHAGFYSGGVPEGPAAFDTLASMGVKTIISVDGAVPDVEAARERGMRYIHLPIGYNGFDDARERQLVRAVRDTLASGPVYLHCHHGKHRSAGAAAAVAVALGWMTPEQAVARMRVSGTSEHYTGLYACAANASVMTPEEIDRVPDDFPSSSIPGGMVKGMIEIDEIFEHLKQIEAAGWRSPADHPDLVPVAEAGRLADSYRSLSEQSREAGDKREFVSAMLDAEAGASALETTLDSDHVDPRIASERFKLIAASCKDCHRVYRD